MPTIRRRNELILGPSYASLQGASGSTYYVSMRDRRRLTKFNGADIVSEIALGGRAGQMVFLDDTGGNRFVVPPGQGLTPTSLIVTFAGFAVQHTAISRVFPGPPGASPNSILIAGTEPASLSWTFTGLAGGTLTHGTQTNSIAFWGGYGLTGTLATVVCNWNCVLTLISSGVYSISVGGLPTIGGSSWGRAASCGIGQTTANINPTPQLSTLPFNESFANGGTFTITPVYA